MTVATPGADAERALTLRSAPGQTKVQPSGRALIVAAPAEESSDKKGMIKAMEKIMPRRGGGGFERRGTAGVHW